MIVWDLNYEWVVYLFDYVDISFFVVGVLIIGFIFGVYMVEMFCGVIFVVDKGEFEVVKVYGMSVVMSFWWILLL